MQATAVVLAAGEGRRVGAGVPKALLTVGGRSILQVAVASAGAAEGVVAVVVAAPAGFEDAARDAVGTAGVPCRVVTGGDTRQASVRAALAALDHDADVVVVHDAARPFAQPALFDTVIDALEDGADGAIPVLPVADTVKRVVEGRLVGTIDRSQLGLAQTPQAFRVGVLRAAHERALAEGIEVTDDAMLLEGDAVVVAVSGDPANFKITTMLDLATASARMEGNG
jgi:2-C-methyl-D-erythritol 4-phosphate cytidylyltransferase / 2-C-methyl-D-erythritol 2,4-cyclodiphosphate synthase